MHNPLAGASERVRERRPVSRAWTQQAAPHVGEYVERSSWARGRLSVISDLVVAEMPDGVGIGAQWHVSVVVDHGRGRRATDAELALVRAAFGMRDAEEDNHEPGRARHLWLTVDVDRRVDCECKADERVIVEPDGHRWSSDPKNVEAIRAEMATVWRDE